MGAVVLLELDDRAGIELALEVAHVRDLGTAEAVHRLVVVADCEHRVLRPGDQLQPVELQAVGILEFVDQDVREARAVVFADRLVPGQQFVAAQDQLGKVGHALALALRLVHRVDLDQLPRLVVERLDRPGPQPGIFLRADEPCGIARLEAFFVDTVGLHHPLDQGYLVRGVHDLERLRQPGLAVVGAQHAVGEPVEGAHPHAAGVDRQHRGDAGQHLACGLVGEGHCQQAERIDLPRLDQPGDARGQYPRLAAAGTGEDHRGLARQGDRGELLRIQVFEQSALHGRARL